MAKLREVVTCFSHYIIYTVTALLFMWMAAHHDLTCAETYYTLHVHVHTYSYPCPEKIGDGFCMYTITREDIASLGGRKGREDTGTTKVVRCVMCIGYCGYFCNPIYFHHHLEKVYNSL